MPYRRVILSHLSLPISPQWLRADYISSPFRPIPVHCCPVRPLTVRRAPGYIWRKRWAKARLTCNERSLLRRETVRWPVLSLTTRAMAETLTTVER